MAHEETKNAKSLNLIFDFFQIEITEKGQTIRRLTKIVIID